MSTRSIIGRAIDGGFVGRYCHWDGYPSARGPLLADTYAQCNANVSAVRTWCLREGEGVNGYWSSFMSPRGVMAQNAKPADRRMGTWVTDNGEGWASSQDHCGAEWAYLLGEDGVSVLARLRGEWRHEATVAWTDLAATDWAALERPVHALSAS